MKQTKPMTHKILAAFLVLLATTLASTDRVHAYVNPDGPLWSKQNQYHLDFSTYEKLLVQLQDDSEIKARREWLKQSSLEEISKIEEQETLDTMYAMLPSGPIPHGKFKGNIIIAKDGPLHFLANSLGNDAILKHVEKIGEFVWKGKVFNRETMVLQNRIIVPSLGERYLFPAKLFCGQSKLDSRRESVIIDYAYNETIDAEGMYSSGPAFGGNIVPELRKPLDMIVGRKALNIRDEIRMVRPGLYLGRAYLQNIFLLNFVLELEDPNEPGNMGNTTEDDCWSGLQKGIFAKSK